jgi:hypothetical protein
MIVDCRFYGPGFPQGGEEPMIPGYKDPLGNRPLTIDLRKQLPDIDGSEFSHMLRNQKEMEHE